MTTLFEMADDLARREAREALERRLCDEAIRERQHEIKFPTDVSRDMQAARDAGVPFQGEI